MAQYSANELAKYFKPNPRYRGIGGMSTSGLVGEPTHVGSQGEGWGMGGSEDDFNAREDRDFMLAQRNLQAANRQQDYSNRQGQMARENHDSMNNAAYEKQRQLLVDHERMRRGEMEPGLGFGGMVDRGGAQGGVDMRLEQYRRNSGRSEGGGQPPPEYVQPNFQYGQNPYFQRAFELNQREAPNINQLRKLATQGTRG